MVEITEGTEGDRFWRGDAVEVVTAAPDRVEPPCPVAGPGGCGGCDFQHITVARQRRLKAEVLAEQFRRLAGLEITAGVNQVAGDEAGLRYRTRIDFAVTEDGRRGQRAHRSHRIVPVSDCLIAHPEALAGTSSGQRSVTVDSTTHVFAVPEAGFWQVHRGAPVVLVKTVLSMLAPRAGDAVADLYAGVGLFARFLGEAVAPTGRVTAVEGDPRAARAARDNLTDVPRARVYAGPVPRVLAEDLDEPFDLVVLDPPREGARRRVVEQIVDRAPRAVAYVACDPAALARDVATFVELGYGMTEVRAFDVFPMTHHVECVALLEKNCSDLR